MHKRIQQNSLFVKILCIVVTGIICVSLSVSYITINLSKEAFTRSYSDSQSKVFERIYNELYNFHEDIVKIINSVNSNRATRLFFTQENLENMELYRTIYLVQDNMKYLLETNTYDISILTVGLNGESYLSTKEKLTNTEEEILSMDISQKALEYKNSILYQYLDKGFTSSTKKNPVIVITKALTLDDGTPYAIMYFTIKEEDFEKFYDYFTGEINDIFVIDSEKRVISSNKKENIGIRIDGFNDYVEELYKNKKISEVYKDNNRTLLVNRLPYCNLSLCGRIDNDKAFSSTYNISKIITICIVITLAILGVIFIIVRQVTRPLYVLTKKMGKVKNGKFDEYVEVNGPNEIKELSETFNIMIKDLNKYVDELIKVQKDKRKAEIHALQMQINPHYVFNTLASIKWLIWQGNNEKSIKAIDSFIILLRNTISNTDEFITLEQEIENLKNYVFINNIRYGDMVKVEFFLMPNCSEYLVPKLILQPFIENAFFHGFPSGREGLINVFVREQNDNILFEICDDGVGIEEEKLDKIKEKIHVNNNFTGIGVNNVDDRIKLIYGNDYGIEMKSKVDIGTKVRIILPKRKK